MQPVPQTSMSATAGLLSDFVFDARAHRLGAARKAAGDGAAEDAVFERRCALLFGPLYLE